MPSESRQYLSRMALDGTWGGMPEIVAFCNIFNVLVRVYFQGNDGNFLSHTVGVDNGVSINLILRQNHYDLLIPNSANSPQQPPREPPIPRVKQRRKLPCLTKACRCSCTKMQQLVVHMRGEHGMHIDEICSQSQFIYLIAGSQY